MHELSFDTSYDYSGSRIGIEVPIILRCSGCETGLLAKVDTGADYCIFNRSHAEELGIDVETGNRIPIATTTGHFYAWGHAVTMECLGLTIDTTVYFAEPPEFPRNVVGRAGWLTKFRIAIIDHDSQLFASPYDA